MPRWIETDVNNFLPTNVVFEMPAGTANRPTVTRLADGAVILEAVPLIANQDLVYYGYELNLEALFGLDSESYWNVLFTGRLTTECAISTLDQFEGLPLTDSHMDVEIGRRDEVSVGTFLRDGVLDGDLVRTRALVYSAPAIIKVETEGSELSIAGMAFMESNANRGQPNEPDFFIRQLNLNHVALVTEGRAGPAARLLNHKAALASSKKEVKSMKVTINGVEMEVPDVAVNHFSAQISALETQVANNVAATTSLDASVASLTTERDTALGALSAAETALAAASAKATELANAAPDVSVEATRIANEHATFSADANRLGYADELTLGGYEQVKVMNNVLKTLGHIIPDTASDDLVRGAWGFALANASKSGNSVLDKAVKHEAPMLNVAQAALEKVNARYFGGAKKEQK